jgi:hypothetical protein
MIFFSYGFLSPFLCTSPFFLSAGMAFGNWQETRAGSVCFQNFFEHTEDFAWFLFLAM